MLSKTKIRMRKKRKTNPELAEAIKLASKNQNWMNIAKILSGPTRKYSSLNLFQIDEKAKTGDTILITGKILSKGDLTKKIKIIGLSISAEAKEKLKTTKSEFIPLIEEIKKNVKFEGIKILR